MQNYTATNNPTAAYGEQSPSVLSLQQNLNKQNTGKAGYVPLLEDSKYGPKTLAATTFQPQSSNLINTSTKSRTAYNQNVSDLATAMAKISGTPTTANPNPSNPADTTAAGILGDTTDPIISGLNTLQTNTDAATKSLIASTQAAYQNKMNTVNKQYGNYSSGLQQLGVETNQAQATPDLLVGHIQQAANDKMDKINALSAEESKALIDAQTAKSTNDFKTLQAKMDYVKQVQAQKATAIKDMYDTISSADKTAAIEAHDLFDIADTLDKTVPQGGTQSDYEKFVIAAAQKYNVPVLSLVQALTDEKGKRDAATLKTQNTKSIIAKRAGGGASAGTMSKAQIDQGTQILLTGKDAQGNVVGNPKGADGYVDPSVYIKLFTDWKGTTPKFLTAYPVKNVNPASYSTLPEAIRPKTSGSSSSSSGRSL